MASVRTVPSRLITTAVWGSGTLIGVILVQILTGWGDSEAQKINDFLYVPVTLLTAALGLRIVLRRGLDPRERRAWAFLGASFGCQLVAHLFSVLQDFVAGMPPYPTISDYWYVAAIVFMV